jgi:penicillin-binding protein 2
VSTATIETHAARNPRLLAFYGLVALLVLVLGAGVGYQQLFQSWKNSEEERKQSQRRIIIPGPRGNIYDREGRVLVGNRARFSVVLNLADLRPELRAEYSKVVKNYRDFPKAERPSPGQLERIARQAVAQRYLDQINGILARREQVRPRDLDRHFSQQLLLPYTLLDDLSPEEYARLIEKLPVNSPLQVYASSSRYYPFGSAAAHVLGYVGIDNDPEAEEFPGEDLLTFKMKGAFGRDGLEKKFDDMLQGQAGGAIYRVDPAGYKINPPLEKRTPVQGRNLTTSLDIDLQQVAEEAIGDRTGAAVALDVRTGEVLVMASKPDYDLNSFMPRLSADTAKEINDKGAWLNQAVNGLYPPGSTFKILTTIAALRRAAIVPDRPITYCDGTIQIGNRTFYCDNGHGHHGNVTLAEAIAKSCDVYYYEAGRLTTPEGIAEEARRFHFGQKTGIELPFETGGMLVPDPAWKQEKRKERWFPGDTANYSIGQGFLLVTPLEMACFAASVGRDELYTIPTLLHRDNAPTQHAPKIGLSAHEREVLLEGMEGTTTYGTASIITKGPYKVPGVSIAGKTGTAQKQVTIDGKTGNINYAWFICFAPVENPEIAIAISLEGDTIGENYGGGLNAAPVANAIIKKYFEKKNATPVAKPDFKVK